jgi:hypothetical protein
MATRGPRASSVLDQEQSTQCRNGTGCSLIMIVFDRGTEDQRTRAAAECCPAFAPDGSHRHEMWRSGVMIIDWQPTQGKVAQSVIQSGLVTALLVSSPLDLARP